MYDSGSKEGLSVETVAIGGNFIFNKYFITIIKYDNNFKNSNY